MTPHVASEDEGHRARMLLEVGSLSSWLAGIPVVHSHPGTGDVVARLANGSLLRAESKKGPLGRQKTSPEYPLLREALGQLVTVAEAGDEDILAFAVPHSARFAELTARWSKAPSLPGSG